MVNKSLSPSELNRQDLPHNVLQPPKRTIPNLGQSPMSSQATRATVGRLGTLGRQVLLRSMVMQDVQVTSPMAIRAIHFAQGASSTVLCPVYPYLHICNRAGLLRIVSTRETLDRRCKLSRPSRLHLTLFAPMGKILLRRRRTLRPVP